MAKKSDRADKSEEANTSLQLDDVLNGEQLSPELDRLYSELGLEGEVQVNVYVYLIAPDQAKESRIWQGTPSEYDLMTIARKFGSGDYRVKIYVPSTTGNMVIRGNKIIPVLLDPAEDARIARIRRGESETPVTVQPINADSIKLMIAETLKGLIPQAPTAQVNPMGLIKEVADIVRTMMPAPAPTTPQMNPLELLRFAAEFARGSVRESEPLEHGVNATGNDIFLRLIDKFAPLFAEQIKVGGTAALPNGTVVASQPAGSAAQPAQPAPTAEEMEMISKLRMGLEFLCMQAENNADPETYADVVLDNVPEDSIAELVKNPDPIAYLAQFSPNVTKHREWFGKLMDAVKLALTEEPPAA